MENEIILTNAIIVSPGECFRGSVRFGNGQIVCVDSGNSSLPSAVDLGGDYLLPGLIELHTDNLEKYLAPRPKVFWPSPLTALMAHDSIISGAGITTVLDSVFLGASDLSSSRPQLVVESIKAIRHARELNITRAEHLLHLRCELPDEKALSLFEEHFREPLLRLVSLNDHTPGQRQWRDMTTFRAYHRVDHMSEEGVSAMIQRRKDLQAKNLETNRRRILSLCREIQAPLASHDDTTEEHIIESLEAGVTIVEFPTTMTAARKAKELGLHTIVGAPNLVRGASHSANVSARELAAAGLVDALSSDYFPAGLLEAAFTLHYQMDFSLPEAIATVTRNPADMVGLSDRGQIAIGKRADLIQVRVIDRLPIVRHAWMGGRQTH